MPGGHVMPRFEDRWCYLYLDQGRLERQASSLAFYGVEGSVQIPINQLGVLLLGPGTSVTHGAMKALVGNRSLVCWTGAGGARFYAHGAEGSRSSRRLLTQAQQFCDEESRNEVIRRMYQKRFPDSLPASASLDQIRGMEGARVRAAYQEMSRRYGVPWEKRAYDPENWNRADPVNRALSVANALLYGVCHAAILAAGYSPAIGFIHTGKMLSFVYDVADFYKASTTLPTAFEAAQTGGDDIERRTRMLCRDTFHQERIMERAIPDIREVLNAGDDAGEDAEEPAWRIITLADRAQAGRLPWEPERPGERRAVGDGDSEG